MLYTRGYNINKVSLIARAHPLAKAEVTNPGLRSKEAKPKKTKY